MPKKSLSSESYSKNASLPGGRSSNRTVAKTSEKESAFVYSVDPRSNFIINDVALNIPPTNINISKEDVYWNWKTLRSAKSTKVPSGQGFCQVTLNIIFTPDLILHLHRLIVEIKHSPFISVQNDFIKDAIDPSLDPEKGDNVFQQMAFVVTNFHINEATGLPGSFIVRLDMKWFNYLPYTPNYLYKKDYLTLPIKSASGTYIQKTIPVIGAPDLARDFAEIHIENFAKHFKQYNFLLSKDFVSLFERSKNNTTLEQSLNNFSGVLMDGMELPSHIAPSIACFAYDSNIYKRYMNDLQFESLYHNFGIDVFREYHSNYDTQEPEERETSLAFLKFTKGHRATAKHDKEKFSFYEVQSFHLEDSSIAKSIMSRMHSHHSAFELNYNSYIRNNMPPFVERCKRKFLQAEFLKDIKIVPESSYSFPNKNQVNIKGFYNTGRVNGNSYGRSEIKSKDVKITSNIDGEKYSFSGYGKFLYSLDEYENKRNVLHPPLGNIKQPEAKPWIRDGYGIRKKHPIKKTRVAHKGIDVDLIKNSIVEGTHAFLSYSELQRLLNGKSVPGVKSKYGNKIKAKSKVIKSKIKEAIDKKLNKAEKTLSNHGVACIFAVESGVVTFSGQNGGYGSFIRIESADTTGNGDIFLHEYAHLSVNFTSKGQTVKKGEIIGFLGNSGNSTGEHLHFEILVKTDSGAKNIPPYPFLQHAFATQKASSENPPEIGDSTIKTINKNSFDLKKDKSISALSKSENKIFDTYVQQVQQLYQAGYQPYLRGGSPGKIMYRNQNLPLTNLSSLVADSEDHKFLESIALYEEGIRNDPSIVNYEAIKEELLKKYGTLKINQEVFVTSCSASFSNIVASIPIVGYEFPTTQHMGSMEPGYAFEIQSFDRGLSDNKLDSMSLPMKHLHSALNNLQKQARDFREAPDSHAFSLNTFLTRLMGSFRVTDTKISTGLENEINSASTVDITPRMVVNRSQVSNVEGYPGRYLMLLELSETNPFHVEQLQVVKERKEFVGKDLEYWEVLKKIKDARKLVDANKSVQKAIVIDFLKSYKGSYDGEGGFTIPTFEGDGFTLKTYDHMNSDAPPDSYGGYFVPVGSNSNDQVIRDMKGHYGDAISALMSDDSIEAHIEEFADIADNRSGGDIPVYVAEVDGGNVKYLVLQSEDFEEFYNDYPWFKDRDVLTGENTITELIYFVKLLNMIEMKIRFTISEAEVGGIPKDKVNEILFDAEKWSLYEGTSESSVRPSLWRNYVYYTYHYLHNKVIADGIYDSLDGALGWSKEDLNKYQRSVDYGNLYGEYNNPEEKYETLQNKLMFNMHTYDKEKNKISDDSFMMDMTTVEDAPNVKQYHEDMDMLLYDKKSFSKFTIQEDLYAEALKDFQTELIREQNERMIVRDIFLTRFKGKIFNVLHKGKEMSLEEYLNNSPEFNVDLDYTDSIVSLSDDFSSISINSEDMKLALKSVGVKVDEKHAYIEIDLREELKNYLNSSTFSLLYDGVLADSSFAISLDTAGPPSPTYRTNGIMSVFDLVRLYLNKDENPYFTLKLDAHKGTGETITAMAALGDLEAEAYAIEETGEELYDEDWNEISYNRYIDLLEKAKFSRDSGAIAHYESQSKEAGLIRRKTDEFYDKNRGFEDYNSMWDLTAGIFKQAPSFPLSIEKSFIHYLSEQVFNKCFYSSGKFEYLSKLRQASKSIIHSTPGPTDKWDVQSRDEAFMKTFMEGLPVLENTDPSSGGMGVTGSLIGGVQNLLGENNASSAEGLMMSQLSLRAVGFERGRDVIFATYLDMLNTMSLNQVVPLNILEQNLPLLRAYANMRFSPKEINSNPQMKEFVMFIGLKQYFKQYVEWFVEPRLINNFGLDRLVAGDSNFGASINRGFGGFFQTTSGDNFGDGGLSYDDGSSGAGKYARGGGVAIDAYVAKKSVELGGKKALEEGAKFGFKQGLGAVARGNPIGLSLTAVELGWDMVGTAAAYQIQKSGVTYTSDGFQASTILEGEEVVETDKNGESRTKYEFDIGSLNKISVTGMLIKQYNSATYAYYNALADEKLEEFNLNGSRGVTFKNELQYGSEDYINKKYGVAGEIKENDFSFNFKDIRTDDNILKKIELSKYVEKKAEIQKLEAFRNELKSLVQEVKKNREICIALGINFLNQEYNYIPAHEKYSGIECYPDLQLPKHPFYSSSNFETGPAFYMWDIYTDGGSRVTKEYLDDIEENAKIYLEGAYNHIKKMEENGIMALSVSDQTVQSMTSNNTNGMATSNEASSTNQVPVQSHYTGNKVYFTYQNVGECNHPFFTGQKKRDELTDALKERIILMIKETEPPSKSEYHFTFTPGDTGSGFTAKTREQVVAQRTALYRYLRFVSTDANKSVRKPFSAKVADGLAGFPGYFYDASATIGGWAVGMDGSYIMDGQQGIQSPSDAMKSFNVMQEVTGIEPLRGIVKNNSTDTHLLYTHENDLLEGEIENMKDMGDEIFQIENMFGNGAGYVGDLIEEKENHSQNIEGMLNDIKLRGLGAQSDYNQTFSLEGLNSLAKASSARLFTEKKKLSRAFPTFKLFFVEEDEFESRFINMDDFYSFNGVRSFSVSRSRENAADAAIISLQNVSGTLDGTRKGATVDVDYFSKKRVDRLKKERSSTGKNSSNTLVSYEGDNNNTVSENDQPFSSVVLRPGMNVQLRAGYSNNPDNLEVLISGRVTDISWGGAGDTCEIVIQSFGTELVQQIKGMEPLKERRTYYATHQLLGDLMLSPELKHFGRWETGTIFQYGESQDNRLDFFRYKENSDKSTLEGYKVWGSFLSDYGLVIAIGSVVTAIGGMLGSKVGLGRMGFGLLRSNGMSKFVVETFDDGVRLAEAGFKSRLANFLSVSVATMVNARFLPGLGMLGRGAQRLGLERVGGVLSRGGFNTVTGYSALKRALLEGGENVLGKFGHLLKHVSDDLAVATGRFMNSLTAGFGKLITESSERVTSGMARGALESLRASLKALPNSAQVAMNTSLRTQIDDALRLLSGNVDDVITPAQLKGILEIFVASERFAVALISPASGARAVFLQGFKGAGMSNLFYGGGVALNASLNFASIFFKSSLFLFTVNQVGKFFWGENLTDTYKEYRRLYQNWFTKQLVYFKLNPADDNLYPPSPIYYMHNLTHIYKDWSDELSLIIQATFSDFSGNHSKGVTEFLNNWKNVNPILYLKRVTPKACEYTLQASTIWDVFYEMTLRHPGWIYSAVPYGKEFRYTMFFGIPSQRYWSKPATPAFVQRMNAVREILTASIDDHADLQRFYKQAYNESLKDFAMSDEQYDNYVREKAEATKKAYASDIEALLLELDKKPEMNSLQSNLQQWRSKSSTSFNYFVTAGNINDPITDEDLDNNYSFFSIDDNIDNEGSVRRTAVMQILRDNSKVRNKIVGSLPGEVSRFLRAQADLGLKSLTARVNMRVKAQNVALYGPYKSGTNTRINDALKKYYQAIHTNSKADRTATFKKAFKKATGSADIDKWNDYNELATKKELETIRGVVQLRSRLMKEYLTGLETRFVPFRNYHLIRSRENLIRNNFSVSQKNTVNSVNVHFKNSEKEYKPESIFMKASSGIPDSNLITGNVDRYDIKHRAMATRYGIGSLIYGMKEMYGGEISILGDPSIKPWDVCFLFDDQNKMSGPVEVKSVTHLFSFESGYITEIVPNAIVIGNEASSWPVIEALKVYVGGAIARERNVTGGGNATTKAIKSFNENSKKVGFVMTDKDSKELEEAIFQANEDTAKELGEIPYGTWGQRMLPRLQFPDLSVKIDGYDLSFKSAEGMTKRYAELVSNGLIEYKETVNGMQANVNLNPIFSELRKEGSGSYFGDEEEFRDMMLSTSESLFNQGVSAYFAVDALSPNSGSSGQVTAKTLGLGTVGLSLLSLSKYKGIKAAMGGIATAAISGVGVYGLGAYSQYTYNTSAVLDRFTASYLIAAPIIFSKLLETEAVTIVPVVKEGKELFAGISTRTPTSVWKSILGDIVSGIDDAFLGVFDTIDENQAMGTEFYKHIVSRNPERANDPGLRYLKDSGQLLKYIKGN